MNVNVTIGEVNPRISTYGGEQWIEDIEINDYGIEIGDIHIDGLNSDSVKKLVIALVNHLGNNGHRFEFKNNGEFTSK